MTEDEADQIMLQMSSVWWQSKLPDLTLKQWHDFFLVKQFPICQEAVTELALSTDYWPSFNQFWITYNASLRKAHDARPVGVLPGVEYLPKEENIRRLRELRDTLKHIDRD
jgi:hypothetical protein